MVGWMVGLKVLLVLFGMSLVAAGFFLPSSLLTVPNLELGPLKVSAGAIPAGVLEALFGGVLILGAVAWRIEDQEATQSPDGRSYRRKFLGLF